MTNATRTTSRHIPNDDDDIGHTNDRPPAKDQEDKEISEAGKRGSN
jgi:hypothetical protein